MLKWKLVLATSEDLPPQEQASILRDAGFETVTWTPLLFGVAAIHEATKSN